MPTAVPSVPSPPPQKTWRNLVPDSACLSDNENPVARSVKTCSSLVSLSVGLVLCLAPARLQAADWPQWRSPNRDGKSGNIGLLKQWPAKGPTLAWKATGLGKAYAGVSRAEDTLFTMGDKDAAGFVIALNAADGKICWSAKVGLPGAPDAPGWSYPGPRCTPTVSGDLVFAVDAWGELIDEPV